MTERGPSEFLVTPISRAIWEDRYALKDANGKLIESNIFDTFERVSKAIASKEKEPEKWQKAFYEVMANKQFCPAGRVLAHAGTHYPQLLNCFVLPFRDDSLEEIMHTASDMAIVQKHGGGVGFNYSLLRPAGSYIKGVNGRSCGIIGFLGMMSIVSEVIEQGGSRRGASLGLLEIWHPDIWEFVSYKTEHNWDRLLSFMDIKDPIAWEEFKFENTYKWQMYNVSVGVMDEFLDAVRNDGYWEFYWNDMEWFLYSVSFDRFQSEGAYNSINFEVTADCDATALWKVRKKVPYPTANDKFRVISKRRVKASEIWDKICYNAWADGCPGLLNLSTIRKMHNLEYISKFLSVNPCGEQPISAHSSCNLGSIVLPSFVKNGEFDYSALSNVVSIAIRFMDNVIDNCEFPFQEIKDKALSERRVGLGTMGVHDMLIAMKLGYSTVEGREVVASVLQTIRDTAYRTSIELAKEKGCFPLFDKEKYLQSGFVKTLPEEIQKLIEKDSIRNGTLISQAPTGTIGTMYGVSTGCEPWFALSFQRNSRLGSYEDGCQEYLKWKKDHPEESKPDYFKTAQEISPENHILMMILFSKYTCSAVSKTINLPNSATVEDVKKAFLFAMQNGVKGITVFRDGCKDAVLKSLSTEDKKPMKPESKEGGSDLDEISEKDVRSHFKKRGNRTTGATSRVHLAGHNMYVTVNKNTDGDMVEVFATVGESKAPNSRHTSGVEDSWAEGLGKMISLALRAGVNPESIIRNLKNIPSDKPVFTSIGDCESSEHVSSPPHAIGRVMEEELKYAHQIPIKNEIHNKGYCIKCGSSNINQKAAGCYDCIDCGYSGCS